ncbi:GFA family protein [Aeromonas sp. HMWF015]|uniref:GFA family protein n=1 Tax=Aeromonas sp. HMWF015 TaxID=2056851 RepID=UPI000D3582B6|nr:GFA family protein [Aeromonas sp. HMWF015]PTT50920.1 ADP-ribosylglycohydrolase [Aeromonas sp. HMWF015]HEH9398201.1 GFA family protein [Aeromonas sobria]HEH9425351.1 GFA family protein [Aeromonas sobria]
MKELHASCLCGAVALILPDQFDYMGNCHCSECRKFSGGDYASVGGLDGNKVTIVKGEEAIGRYRKSAETTLAFCRHCGSSLFSQKSSSGKINLRLGVLDDVPSQRPAFHIFVGSKAPWHQIGDDCPQFDTRPPV